MEPVNETRDIVAYCRACGKGLTPEMVHNYQGTVYCQEHMPHVAQQPPPSSQPEDGGPNPYQQPPRAAAVAGVSPGWAFVLGLIPGVGAIYNGQYAKGFIHALLTGLLGSLASNGGGASEALFEFLIPVWIFYMAFEAYHTAKQRMIGEPVDEFSSIFPNASLQTGFPVLPILLIVLGVLFLLDNLQLLSLRALRPYAAPVLLIALGVFMLYSRLKSNAQIRQEARHERS